MHQHDCTKKQIDGEENIVDLSGISGVDLTGDLI